MGKFSLLDFIRGMKKSNYKQLKGHLFAVEKDSGDLCGCALGQGLLNSGLFDTEKIRKEIIKNGTKTERRIYNPITKQWEMIQVLIGSGPEVLRASEFLDDVIDPKGSFVQNVIELNDEAGVLVGDIAAQMYQVYADKGV